MFVSDFTKSPEEVVIDLINFDNGKNFTPATLRIVDVPLAIPKSPPIFRNTEIVVTAPVAVKKRGQARLWYNRIDLNTVPANRSTVFETPTKITKLSEVIPAVNERYRINLTPADYIDVPMTVLDFEPVKVTIQTAPHSLVYIGYLEIDVVALPVDVPPIGSVFLNRFLDIFKYFAK